MSNNNQGCIGTNQCQVQDRQLTGRMPVGRGVRAVSVGIRKAKRESVKSCWPYSRVLCPETYTEKYAQVNQIEIKSVVVSVKAMIRTRVCCV